MKPNPQPQPPLRPGNGTQLTHSALGSVLSASVPRGFAHPFQPTLAGDGVRFRRGEVDGVEPKINGVPMSGKESDMLAVPALKLSPGVANGEGESWAVLEVLPGETGRVDKEARVEIVHRSTPVGSQTDKVGRCPIALILWRGRQPAVVWPLIFFNLRYHRRELGAGELHHFFF